MRRKGNWSLGGTAGRVTGVVLGIALLMNAGVAAKTEGRTSLKDYVDRMQAVDPQVKEAPLAGSLWSEQSDFADLAADRKAHKVGDVIVIRVAEQTVAGSSGSVSTSRKFAADSGIQALAGQINTQGIGSLFSPTSNATLDGKGATSSRSSLSASVAGKVVALLGNGNLVVEAERFITMNRERQHIRLRGIVRRGDIAADGSVASSLISDFEVEVQGKGVVSDATRSPNPVIRGLLWLVGF